MKISGTIVYNDFEGGFWGIIADDGKKYRPVDELPESMKQEGLFIEAHVEPSDEISFIMWGISVKLLSIQNQ